VIGNHQFAEVNDLNTHYVREGHGQPPILLHDWPEFRWGCHQNILALATRFDVIAPGLRGFGDTRDTGARRPARTPTLETSWPLPMR
jgi:pimeloyl-ACP methyl ester carboxylesterase